MTRKLVARAVGLVALVAVIALCGHTSLSADTYPRQPGIDAQHYVFRLTLLTGESNEIQGEATVTLRVTADNVREAFLDLATPTADGKGMTVSAVTLAGRAVAFDHKDSRLRLTVPAGTTRGQDLAYTIAYRGVPANGLRLLNNIHGERTAFSENWYNRARQWLPTIDHIADKASGEFIVTTRAEYQVISNGLLAEQLDLPGGLRRTHWKQAAPISPWLYSLGIAHFVVRYGAVTHGVQLSYWAFPQDTEKGLASLERDARGSFEFFSDQVGPFAYEKLAHVEAAGMSGGTEHVSNIFYGEKGVTVGNAPVVHETAHQWFGDAVTENDWNDVWLSEGITTYFTLLYTEHASGRDAFVDGLRKSRDTVLKLEATTLQNTPVVHANLAEATVSPNNQLVYQKGAWTMHMLRDLIGTEPFWKGIRLYYQRHMNGVASTDDLRRAMETVSGKDLGWFFRQWLTRAGSPSIEGTWRYDPAAKQVHVTLKQTQATDPFRLSIGIGVVTGSALPVVRKYEMTGRDITIDIASDTEPSSVTLDPNVWTLATFGTLQKAGGR